MAIKFYVSGLTSGSCLDASFCLDIWSLTCLATKSLHPKFLLLLTVPFGHTGAFLAYSFKMCQTVASPVVHSPPLFQACLPHMHTTEPDRGQCPCSDDHRPHDETPSLPATSSLCSPWLFFVQRTTPCLTHPRLGTVTPFLCRPCHHPLWVWFQDVPTVPSRISAHRISREAWNLARAEFAQLQLQSPYPAAGSGLAYAHLTLQSP